MLMILAKFRNLPRIADAITEVQGGKLLFVGKVSLLRGWLDAITNDDIKIVDVSRVSSDVLFNCVCRIS
jgi:hypothetical protein